MQYDDDSYGCQGGHRLSFYIEDYYSEKAACLTTNEINDSMYKVDGKDVYADKASCGYTLGMVTRTEDTILTCITI